MALENCGIDSVEALDSLSFRVTFVPEEGGDAIPLEADALDLTKWVLYAPGGYEALVLAAVEKVSDYVYDLYFNHRSFPPRIGLSIESAAITTDQGGYCDTPEVESFWSTGDKTVEVEPISTTDIEFGPVSIYGEPLYTSSPAPRRRKSSRRR